MLNLFASPDAVSEAAASG